MGSKKSHISWIKIWVITLLPMFIFINKLVGQDIHFSQFFNSPLNLNPSLTGNFIGDIRLVANQRTQWSSVTTPYVTFALSGEYRNIYNTSLNAGLSIFHDKAGDSQFSTLQIGVPISYTLYISDSSQTVQFGMQPSFVQRSINYDDLRFDNQYDGTVYNSTLGNGETFGTNGRNYFNLHAGISWNYLFAQRKSVNVGFAVHNLTQPEQSFFSGESIPLKHRYTFHAGTDLKVHNNFDVLPRVMLGYQHNYKEIIMGGSLRYHLNNGNYRNLYGGIYYRNSDAAYLTAGIDYHNFHFKISYDINVSSLEVASNNRGGFEFALIYIFEKYKPVIKRYKACPNFI